MRKECYHTAERITRRAVTNWMKHEQQKLYNVFEWIKTATMLTDKQRKYYWATTLAALSAVGYDTNYFKNKTTKEE